MKQCKYCSYEWQPRKATPKACPQCKRYMYDNTRQERNENVVLNESGKVIG